MSANPVTWQHDEFATRVAAYLDCARVTQDAVPNLITRIDCVGHDGMRMPVTVNDGGSNGSWVCSPHVTYVRYAAEEAARIGHPLIGRPLALLCHAVGLPLRWSGIDRAVALNNWTLSTNLFPPLDARELHGWIEECIARWPDHAIWVRSLNASHTADWLRGLQARHWLLIPSRQVYLYDQLSPQLHANLRRDLHLLQGTTLVVSPAAEWNEADFREAARLYALLYLQKYSMLNPAYSARWLQAWSGAGLLDLSGFRDRRGALVGVIGTFALGRLITAPIVGYDTSLPQRLGLYRLLMATVYREAMRSGRRINLSAGAAGFKRLRGGVGSMEYSAVYVRHLPRRRQLPVNLLAQLARRVGEPVLRRYEL